VTTDGGAQRLIKHVSVEAMLKGLRVEEGSAEWPEVLRLCGDGKGGLASEVPVEHFRQLLLLLADARFGHLPLAERLARVGASLLAGYRTTLLGQVQLAALHLVGPERFLRKAPDIVGRTTNFGARSSEERAPRDWVVRFRGVPLPGDYYLGMLRGFLTATGVQSPRTRWEQVGPEDMDFFAAW
jgi:uncharacterized protein (TIGR02265 family)